MTEQEAKQRLMPWGWRAEEQWTLARPKHVKELKQSGIFYQSLKRDREGGGDGSDVDRPGSGPVHGGGTGPGQSVPPTRRPPADTGGAGENSVLSNYILPLEIEAGEEEKARFVSTAIAVALTAFIALAVRRKMEAALQRAVVHRRPPRGLIIHSDHGVQYACTAFAKWVNDHGFVQSMSRKGDCWDNAVAESFFHLLKTELTYHERWLDY